ncbi:MAG: fructosamine kinase family protein [Proteobacteria bacterium]|nr:fructosamine kinase family protein [Pseudomonadota bacterium]
MVEKAKHVFFELSGSQGRQALLHGDLHHDNILFDEKRGWLAIDPKGVIGEAEIEVAAFLKNPIGHPEIYTNEEVIQSRISTISRELNLNKERVIRWAFALTVLSCIWLKEIEENPDDWLALAGRLEEIL